MNAESKLMKHLFAYGLAQAKNICRDSLKLTPIEEHAPVPLFTVHIPMTYRGHPSHPVTLIFITI